MLLLLFISRSRHMARWPGKGDNRLKLRKAWRRSDSPTADGRPATTTGSIKYQLKSPSCPVHRRNDAPRESPCPTTAALPTGLLGGWHTSTVRRGWTKLFSRRPSLTVADNRSPSVLSRLSCVCVRCCAVSDAFHPHGLHEIY